MKFDQQDALRLAHAAQHMLQSVDEIEEFIECECAEDGSTELSRHVVGAASTLEFGLEILRSTLDESTHAMIQSAGNEKLDAPNGYATAHHWAIVAGESCLESLLKQIEPLPERPKNSANWLELASGQRKIRPPGTRSCQQHGFSNWMELAPKVVREAEHLISYLQKNGTEENAT